MQQSSENRIRLYFPDMQKLWAFAKTLTGHAIEINTAPDALPAIAAKQTWRLL